MLAEFDCKLPLAPELPWSPLLDEVIEFDWLIDWATFPLLYLTSMVANVVVSRGRANKKYYHKKCADRLYIISPEG